MTLFSCFFFQSQSSDSAVERPSDSGIEGSDNLFADDSKLKASTANTNLIQVLISWGEVQEST